MAVGYREAILWLLGSLWYIISVIKQNSYTKKNIKNTKNKAVHRMQGAAINLAV